MFRNAQYLYLCQHWWIDKQNKTKITSMCCIYKNAYFTHKIFSSNIIRNIKLKYDHELLFLYRYRVHIYCIIEPNVCLT